MTVEYVPEFDEDGGYTESVPDGCVKEELDCCACSDVGCPQCQGPEVGATRVFTLDEVCRNTGPSPFGHESPF